MSMNDKYYPYGKHSINNDDIRAVVNVLENENLTQGNQVPLFELEVCRKLHVDHACSFNSATSALHVACLALKVNKRSNVWVPDISFVASANCVRYCDGNVSFMDVDPCTGLICPQHLENKLKEAKINNNLPQVLIVVHLAGTSCNMEIIHKLSRLYEFKVIEDASHAFGAKYKNKYVGDCSYSDIHIQFSSSKDDNDRGRGLATTNNSDIAKMLSLYRSHGIERNKENFIEEDVEFGNTNNKFLDIIIECVI